MTSHQGSDDFVGAVLVAFDPSRAPELRTAAQAYCERIKTSADGYKLCLLKLHQIGKQPQGRPEVKFWCLQVVLGVVDSKWTSLTDEDRGQIRSSLMVFIREIGRAVQQECRDRSRMPSSA
eukprot:TRINITY_DN50182_c0_g1_i2.p1 TRINITY_DN50182_c0_g1~~TRINITY_DN50182_c0_g1_i2.p1  ORF type:complete len:121 (-),score=14.29 TRINITY_DN50182_c0_g1_i2:11-373(-)